MPRSSMRMQTARAGVRRAAGWPRASAAALPVASCRGRRRCERRARDVIERRGPFCIMGQRDSPFVPVCKSFYKRDGVGYVQRGDGAVAQELFVIGDEAKCLRPHGRGDDEVVFEVVVQGALLSRHPDVRLVATDCSGDFAQMIDCGPCGGGRGLRGALREFAAMRFPVCNLVVVRKKEEQVFYAGCRICQGAVVSVGAFEKLEGVRPIIFLTN